MVRTIVLIGAGNVAVSLARALMESPLKLLGIYSRSGHSARALTVGTDIPSGTLGEICPDADLYLISVKDDVIAEATSYLSGRDVLVVHTAGSVSIDVFADFPRRGVVYPLQTFSKQYPVAMGSVPLFLEASSPEVLDELRQFAGTLSSQVFEAGSEQRTHLHLAAVFGSNFTNHLWGIAADLLEQKGFPPEVLHPLMERTLRKAIDARNPYFVQTGPAVRRDELVLHKHLDLLQDQPMFRDIYKLISESIKKRS